MKRMGNTEIPLSNSILTEAGQLLDKLLNKQILVQTAVDHNALKAIKKNWRVVQRNQGLLAYGCHFAKWLQFLNDFSWLNELVTRKYI